MSGFNDAEFYDKAFLYNDFPDADDICYKILVYLLNLPRSGYVPKDEGVRADWIRYLYYDEKNPLDRKNLTLPTLTQKKSLIYNPEIDGPTQKGYRIYQQSRTIEAQEEQQSQFRIFPGVLEPLTSFTAQQLINIEIVVGMSHETLVNGKNRSYQLLLSTLRALNGMAIAGSGELFFTWQKSRGCRAQPFTDGKFNVGYYLTMGVAVNVSEVGVLNV